jgi:hypothetical protein
MCLKGCGNFHELTKEESAAQIKYIYSVVGRHEENNEKENNGYVVFKLNINESPGKWAKRIESSLEIGL